ncbi:MULTISPECIES: phosphate ABC transporter permease subunit PstC [unclassified Synechococcus]|jgi:phosphate transport system permease protein|uniref:phosphate ABC transporter permease subunit PstC n=1 Tax=unclassified Synechococcus TaxID=2626047 RepID=UPI00103ED697|nr:MULTISPECIES: phosphate ABC transporter permease subunit PstC [unclassified Synechococcus]QNG26618.1 phosphate ABC transporter permease subunit PstC [Synechococcus sp. HK01-R]TCD58756.1 phosphate ABC transporter permease subunit PstC [Synechococcus sp. BS56D]
MTSDPREQYLLRRRPASEKLVDVSFKNLAIALASMVAIVLFAILIVVFWGSLESMGRYGWKFLVTSDWNPVDDQYGAFTAIYGTIVTSLLSLAIAVPLGVGTAIFITENIIPLRIREVIGVMVELLAAIPSVVLGLWAIFVLEPFLRPFLTWLNTAFGWIPIFSSPPMGPGMAPAILILVVMILPIITAIARDSLNQVPTKLRQAAYGVGTTRWGAIFNVMLPAAVSGIVGGVMLALGRAMGETMAVTMIIGNSNNFSWSLLAPGNTIAAMLANQFGEADGSQVSSLMYAAFVLIILTLAVNIFAQWLVKRLSLKY